jgi:peroxiredoxin
LNHQRISSVFTLALAAITLWSAAATAEPMTGAPFPHTLNAPDQTGTMRSLKSISGTNGVVLFFVRSADWCPFCKRHLVDVNRRLAKIRSLGVEVVSISVDEVAPIADFSKEQSIGYVMLSDPKGSINETLGLRDTQYPVGSAAFGVPKPTAKVIYKKGVVRFRYQEPTFRTRPNLDAMLEDIRTIAPQL